MKRIIISLTMALLMYTLSWAGFAGVSYIELPSWWTTRKITSSDLGLGLTTISNTNATFLCATDAFTSCTTIDDLTNRVYALAEVYFPVYHWSYKKAGTSSRAPKWQNGHLVGSDYDQASYTGWVSDIMNFWEIAVPYGYYGWIRSTVTW